MEAAGGIQSPGLIPDADPEGHEDGGGPSAGGQDSPGVAGMVARPGWWGHVQPVASQFPAPAPSSPADFGGKSLSSADAAATSQEECLITTPRPTPTVEAAWAALVPESRSQPLEPLA